MRRLLSSFSWLAVTAAVVAVAPAGHAQAPARIAPAVYGGLHWRFIGPEGNRFATAAGIPGDPATYYVGAASGGIYKTVDAGVTWTSLFDAQPVQSIGALAVDPSDANTVWAGTGEAHIRSHISVGQGIYKTQDAGKTWTLMGLEQTGRIARVVVHPKDSNIVLACALGHAYGPQQDRGVFRTTDGGATWTRTLFADENTGCSDLAMDPANPRILFAGMWSIEIRTWGRTSGGPGGGLFTSRDGGVTWKKLTGNGLPTKPVGKVAVAIARSNPNRVYVMIETGDGVPLDGQATESGQVWRSEDGGGTWRIVTYDRNAMGRAHYYSRLAVAPDDEDEVYFLTASYAKSIDGAQTLTTQQRAQAPGGDHHDIWIDPTNANRQIVAHDQGLSITINRGKTWFRQRLTNAQIYHVTVDNEIPYNVLGNKQDEPSYRGPSNSRLGAGGGGDPGIPRAMWHSVGGGESGWATPDPSNSKVVWSTASGSGMVGGIVVRFDENRRQLRNVEVWPYQQNGPPADLKYRFVWDAPLHISPHDSNTIYVGSQHLHRTTNGGQSWAEISPDLTLNDKTRQGSSGGLTPDNIGVEYSGVVYAIAESPRERGLIWVGTNDGLVQLTRDAGKSWTNVTKNLPGLPAWGSVRSIVPSKYDAATAYLSVDFHQMNNRDPFIYKTSDYGRTFTAITSGIPKSMLSYVKVVYEDPVRRGLLYAGTENAIYTSFDDGANWQPLQIDLPHAPVSGIVVQPHFNDLVISTYGRGFFILDDITPLQQLTPQVLAADAHLFPPRAAYRFRPITAPSTTYDDPTVGENPQYGASINYYLKGAAAGAATITILDARNQPVRTLPGSARAGLNRVYWDLRGEPSAAVRLRTSPLYAPQPQFRPGPDGTRPAPGAGQITMLMPPGAYTVKLSVGGRDVTAPLTVLKDPNSEGSEADIEAQTRLVTELRGHANTAAAMVNQIELIRSQLEGLDKLGADAATKTAVNELTQQLIDTEMNLVDLRQTGTGQDGVRFGSKLMSKINYLANGLSGGDFKPTDQHLAAAQVIADEVKKVQALVDALRGRITGGFNEQLKGKNLPPIVVPAPR